MGREHPRHRRGAWGRLSAPGREYNVSHERAFTTRAHAPEGWLLNAGSTMLRRLEKSAYDVSHPSARDMPNVTRVADRGFGQDRL
jgi:hypothetical protein